MRPYELHLAARRGDLARVEELLRSRRNEPAVNLEERDRGGWTVLGHAVSSAQADAAMVRLLASHGADVRGACPDDNRNYSMASLAIRAGDPDKLAVLLEHGVPVFDPGSNYVPIGLAAVSYRALRSPRLVDLLRLVMQHGATVDVASTSDALQCFSREGRFDAVAVLLEAGADESALQWTPLIRAAALGTVDDVRALLDAGAGLEDRDYWSRTALLVAIRSGDIGKAALLLDRGADPVKGHCGEPLLAHAIEGRMAPMLRWLLAQGAPPNDADDFGRTPIWIATEQGDLEAIEILLAAGVDVTASCRPWENCLIEDSASIAVALRLLEASADPAGAGHELQRMLVGLEREASVCLFDATAEEFERFRERRYGTANPSRMDNPFWLAMIRSGITAYQAASTFDKVSYDRPPVWCAQRFGQSITILPDGRTVQIGGEHEDGYDPDFCIYNDVFVHSPDGEIRIYGYPAELFPPTDFHTATLIGRYIYIIGSLGYPGTRVPGTTPVFRLDTSTWKMDLLEPNGDPPGWIYKHRATLRQQRWIEITGGKIVTTSGTRESHTENTGRFVLDTKRLAWSREANPAP